VVAAATTVAVAVAALAGGRTVVRAPRTRVRAHARTHVRIQYTREYARAQPLHTIMYIYKLTRWGSRGFWEGWGGSSCYCGTGKATAAASVANYPYSHARRRPPLSPHHIAVYAHRRRCSRRRVYNNNNNNNIIRATTTSRHGLCSARRLKAIYFHNTTCHTPLPPPPSPTPQCRVPSFRRNYTRPLSPPPFVHAADNASHHFSSDYTHTHTYINIYPCSTVAVRPLTVITVAVCPSFRTRVCFAFGRGSGGHAVKNDMILYTQ